MGPSLWSLKIRQCHSPTDSGFPFLKRKGSDSFSGCLPGLTSLIQFLLLHLSVHHCATHVEELSVDFRLCKSNKNHTYVYYIHGLNWYMIAVFLRLLSSVNIAPYSFNKIVDKRLYNFYFLSDYLKDSGCWGLLSWMSPPAPQYQNHSKVSVKVSY